MELQTLYTKEDSDKILSEIKKNLNPRKELDFNKVLDIAFQDLREKFKFESINVFLLNKAHTHLIPYRLHNPFLPEETTRKLYQMPIPLQEESGITSYIIQKKMNIYIPEIKPEMIFSEWSKEVFRLTKMKSNLMFPLFIDEAVCGIITFPTFDKTLALIEEQIKDVNNYVFYISIALTSMFYSIELKEKSKIIERKNHQMREDLKLAQKIQNGLIPSIHPIIDGVQIASFYKPMEDIGGDFYDFLSMKNPDLTGIFISDVSGHGVPAALITTMIKTLIETSEAHRNKPSSLLSYINQKIMGQMGGNFLTAFYGIYDSAKKTLSYAKAAHNPPFLIRDGEIISLDSKGKMIGVFSNISFEEKEISLKSGDKVLFYTDGLTEAANEEGIEFEETLCEILIFHSRLSVDELLERIYHRLLIFQKDLHFEDDICMVLFGVL